MWCCGGSSAVLESLPQAGSWRGAPAVPSDILKAREIFDANALPISNRRLLGFPKKSRGCSRGVMLKVEQCSNGLILNVRGGRVQRRRGHAGEC